MHEVFEGAGGVVCVGAFALIGFALGVGGLVFYGEGNGADGGFEVVSGGVR